MMRAKIGQKLKRVWSPLEWFQTFRIFTDKNKNTLIKRGKSEGGTHHKIMKQLKGGAADWTQVLGPVPFAFQLSTVAHAGLPHRLYRVSTNHRPPSHTTSFPAPFRAGFGAGIRLSCCNRKMAHHSTDNPHRERKRRQIWAPARN